MAGGMFSNNTTMKVNGAISTTTAGTGTQYTVSANAYAVVTVYGTAAFTVTIGGKTAASWSATSSNSFTQLYAGPGQAIAVSANSGTVTISGVEFINSP